MYQLIRHLTATQLLARQAPALAISIVIAELFYKFHSFTLECAAFLATWFVVDAAAQFLVARFDTVDHRPIPDVAAIGAI